MPFCMLAVISCLIAWVPIVIAHGYVTGIVIGGTYYSGYLIPTFPYEKNPPEVIAWSTTATSLGFVDGTGYASPDIICHQNAKPGAKTADIDAGGTVELQWTTWPESHHGPVVDYLANCNGDCSTVDKSKLEFFKIGESGLIDDSNPPGKWGSDDLIAKNNSWSVKIPTTIKSGNYVLRHEIIALHSAENKDGAQSYPQCINLKVTGSGTDSPPGTLGTALYKDTDAGLQINIYQKLSGYTIPGPPLCPGGSGGSGGSNDSNTNTSSSGQPGSTTTTSALATTPVQATTSTYKQPTAPPQPPATPTSSAITLPSGLASNLLDGSYSF
ncbi:hypothetical protein Egran_00674 [Elaphomyces granulatus]|uniref:Auxiliary Activity family 9 catalytic domain-containing protein n=1 Tax=Elaphomyces granulatus TaxID=519963 RepID=A0A232M564_9EURO|nr:hypothetical protein Egran_00674 [Elaphomyces granulatus]